MSFCADTHDLIWTMYFLYSCRLQNSTNSYIPHNKEWIKEKIYDMLKKQAGPGRR